MHLYSGYTTSPATRLLATHCCVCGRPLVDAESVRSGIGPICAERYGVGDNLRGTAAHTQANALVYLLSAEQKKSSWARISSLLAELRALPSFGVLADKIAARLTPKAEIKITLVDGGATLRVVAPYKAESTLAFRAIPGRRFGKEIDPESAKEIAYNTIPTAQRRALWTLLKTHYAGLYASAPDGSVFEILQAA